MRPSPDATITFVKNFIGSPGLDQIIGDDTDNFINGNGGFDIELRGKGGNDTIWIAHGSAYGDEGDDTITVMPTTGSPNGSNLYGGKGEDSFDFSLITSFDDLSFNIIKDYKRGVDTILLPRLFADSGVSLIEDATTKNGQFGLLLTLNYTVNNDAVSQDFLFVEGINDLLTSDVSSPYANLFDL